MNRTQFEHTVRAAGAVMARKDLLVIGSQALHAVVADADMPEESQRSTDTDVAAFDDPDGALADLVDGSIGEASMFHTTFGYYAQGVALKTAVLPDGWRDRLVRFETSGTGGVTAWCLDVHDLWISKAIAGREKDLEFCAAVASRRLVRMEVLAERLRRVEGLDPKVRDATEGRIKRLAG
jgi:hypothetical protein